jgi:UMF1 family MFS transporter
VLGLDLAAGSLPFYLTSFATIASAFVLPIVGAFVDRSPRKKWHMGTYAWAGAVLLRAAVLHAGRELAARRRVDRDREHARGCSLVSYYAILVDISTEDERDHVSSAVGLRLPRRRLLLAINLAVYLGHDTSGSARGWPSGSRCCPRPSGGPASRSSRWSAAQLRPAQPGRAEGTSSSAASVSSSRR